MEEKMISEQELQERVALLKRFRTLLEQQRTKFQEYLNVLEKQQNSICEENSENLLIHTEIEQQVLKNISNLQKVIVPMSKMCNINSTQNSQETKAITQIQNELSTLQDKVLKQNAINRDLLKIHLEQLRTKLDNLKNPYKNNRSVYSNAQPHKVATLVSVNA